MSERCLLPVQLLCCFRNFQVLEHLGQQLNFSNLPSISGMKSRQLQVDSLQIDTRCCWRVGAQMPLDTHWPPAIQELCRTAQQASIRHVSIRDVSISFSQPRSRIWTAQRASLELFVSILQIVVSAGTSCLPLLLY
jgi:hypothetical protein